MHYGDTEHTNGNKQNEWNQSHGASKTKRERQREKRISYGQQRRSSYNNNDRMRNVLKK